MPPASLRVIAARSRRSTRWAPGNDNIFYTGNPGQLYNEATGLGGVPDLARFAADLAR